MDGEHNGSKPYFPNSGFGGVKRQKHPYVWGKNTHIYDLVDYISLGFQRPCGWMKHRISGSMTGRLPGIIVDSVFGCPAGTSMDEFTPRLM